MAAQDDRVVVDDADNHRYTISLGGEVVGQAVYRDRDDRRIFTHTEVDDAHEGKGLASTLVEAAVADVESRGLKMVPLCPYVKGWLERHPGHEDAVDAELTARLSGG